MKSSGVLIRGLAEAVWNRNRTVEELAAHKDVDVMVLGGAEAFANKFEGGIDWWLPESAKITVREDYGSRENVFANCFINGNNVILNYGFRNWRIGELPPGLYILGSEQIINLRYEEAVARVDTRAVSFDTDDMDSVEETFARRMRHDGVRKTLMAPLLEGL